MLEGMGRLGRLVEYISLSVVVFIRKRLDFY